MSTQIEPLENTAALSNLLSKDHQWLSRQMDADSILDQIEIESELSALDVSIYLMRVEQYAFAERILKRLRAKFPNGGLTHYNSAIAAAGMRDYNQAIPHARRAISLLPHSFEFRSLLVRVYALAGMPDKARNVLKSALPSQAGERTAYSCLAQFTDLCAEFPVTNTRRSLALLEESGSYCEPEGCAEMILSVVREGRPFSMIRLGDGEGAWLSMDAYDEGRFSSLYRANRLEFLRDWFGSDYLIDNDNFFVFARRLQSSHLEHDLIGIPPLSRLDQEEGFLSQRGISTAINTFRFLDLLEGPKHGIKTCSNSVNLALATRTGFYRDLFKMPRQFGLITSQSSLAGRMSTHGVDVLYSYVVPGDSRNFHLTANGQPECQYPDHLERIDAELAASDLRGKVFLVAAGFVGKRYLSTIRSRGGIALDVGSIADHWAKNGLPI